MQPLKYVIAHNRLKLRDQAYVIGYSNKTYRHIYSVGIAI
jgi:hypothetical protein